MKQPEAEIALPAWEPKRPALLATAIFSVWVAILSLPMLAGRFLATSPWSDQGAAGYAFRTWGAEWFRKLGHVPQWNPEMFGGLPYVAAQHGDIFYPTSYLRLFLSMPTVMHIGFVLHYVLAGLFVYALLRLMKTSWAAAVTGGVAYQLTGLMASYPQPGHDGKLFVSTMLPLAMIGLVMALRDRRATGYAVLSLAVGLALLSPHYQMTYYMLVAAGLFALYLTFGETAPEPENSGAKYLRLGYALGAVLLGFGVAMIQILPFIHYLPLSPRAEGFGGFDRATTYAIPWEHVPEFFLKQFTGARDGYWGSNGLKLHSEYLGLPVIALALLGVAAAARRRAVLWLGGIGLLFLLVCLGANTPFYRLWWLMPYVKQTRAPGMAFFVVALIVALFAAFGVERIQRGEGRRHVTGWLIAAGAVAVLGLAGAFGGLARGLAGGVVQSFTARGVDPAQAQQFLDRAIADAPAILLGAISSAIALALVAGLVVATRQGKLKPAAFSVLLALVIGGDLFVNARPFWRYSELHRTLFQLDPVTTRIETDTLPYRVLDLGVYPTDGVTLMAFDIPAVTGHHAFELHRYDQLLGGQREQANLVRGEMVGGHPIIHRSSLQLWDLLAVRYVIAPPQFDTIPGFERVLSNVQTAAQAPANLFKRLAPPPYARVVPAAVKGEVDAIVPTLLDPRLDYNRLVLFDNSQPVTPAAVPQLPEPSASRATFSAWEPGRMTIALDPAPSAPSYVFVSENWYPDWRATVDGQPAQLLRGNQTFITVPVPAGARRVDLEFRSNDYRNGKMITLASWAGMLLLAAAPVVARRRRADG